MSHLERTFRVILRGLSPKNLQPKKIKIHDKIKKIYKKIKNNEKINKN